MFGYANSIRSLSKGRRVFNDSRALDSFPLNHEAGPGQPKENVTDEDRVIVKGHPFF